MAVTPYFIGGGKGPGQANRNLGGGGVDGLPFISERLNSGRTYSWEVLLQLPPSVGSDASEEVLTLAAKQVSQVGFSVEDIEVHRVNDRVYYPGKASPEELTVTFDNLYGSTNQKPAETLWKWFQSIYNPLTGQFTPGMAQGHIGNFKSPMAEIIHLDPQGQPDQATRLLGVYPKSWKTAEFNYASNEFHTIEVTFRYDFMHHGDDEDSLLQKIQGGISAATSIAGTVKSVI